eukprot:scaffold115055_cov72-Phaeocystis_antarctica.AAC.2
MRIAPYRSISVTYREGGQVRPEWRRAGFSSARGCPGRHRGAASLGQSASRAALLLAGLITNNRAWFRYRRHLRAPSLRLRDRNRRR